MTSVALAVALAAFASPVIAAPDTQPAPVPANAAVAATAPDHPDQDTVTVDPATEAILNGAVKYLAAKQSPAGSWAESNNTRPIAITGFSLMAFLATGNLPGEGEYGKNVTAGMQFLLSQQRSDGFLCGAPGLNGQNAANMYDHGIATTALAELYGQTRDAQLRPKLDLAVKLILSAQSKLGGWRYRPVAADADISVTVLQSVALRAAKNSGIAVPDTAIQDAVKFVRSCYNAKEGGFSYMAGGNEPGFARTAAAIYSLQVCGLYEDPMVLKGSAYLIARQDDRKQWYTYGHFYAAPALYMIGGQIWKNWYQGERKTLVEKVKREGDLAFWPELIERGDQLGPSYATAVYTMILAMPYHYIPLYQR